MCCHLIHSVHPQMWVFLSWAPAICSELCSNVAWGQRQKTSSRISINSLYSTYLHTHGTHSGVAWEFTPEFWQSHNSGKMSNTSCAPKTTRRGHAAHYLHKMAAGALSAVNVWTKAQLELSHITCSKLPGAAAIRELWWLWNNLLPRTKWGF